MGTCLCKNTRVFGNKIGVVSYSTRFQKMLVYKWKLSVVRMTTQIVPTIFWRWWNTTILALIRWRRKHDGILWSILDYQSDFNSWCHDILCWEWLWNRMGNSHNFRCIMSNIMTTITTNIANGVDKVVNDVTTAAEAALPVLAEASFQYALQLAFNALLFWLTFRWDAWSLATDDWICFNQWLASLTTCSSFTFANSCRFELCHKWWFLKFWNSAKNWANHLSCWCVICEISWSIDRN